MSEKQPRLFFLYPRYLCQQLLASQINSLIQKRMNPPNPLKSGLKLTGPTLLCDHQIMQERVYQRRGGNACLFLQQSQARSHYVYCETALDSLCQLLPDERWSRPCTTGRNHYHPAPAAVPARQLVISKPPITEHLGIQLQVCRLSVTPPCDHSFSLKGLLRKQRDPGTTAC